jgi:hypothetical protein
MVDRCGEVLFRVDESAIKIEDENGTHGVIIAS